MGFWTPALHASSAYELHGLTNVRQPRHSFRVVNILPYSIW